MTKDTVFSQTFAALTELTAQDLNDLQSDALAGIERRIYELHGNCVAGAGDFEPSLDGASVSFAAGSAYVVGRRYLGPAIYTFGVEATGDYWLYIDAATGTLQAGADEPAAGAGLALCTVHWDGAALSSLVDRRKFRDSATDIEETVYAETLVSLGDEEWAIIDLPIAFSARPMVEILEFDGTGVAIAEAVMAPDGAKASGSQIILHLRKVS